MDFFRLPQLGEVGIGKLIKFALFPEQVAGSIAMVF